MAELEAFALSLGEKAFRGRQLFSWIYGKKARSFEDMTDMSRPLRSMLQQQACIGALQVAGKFTSPRSGTVKYLFSLQDQRYIESVLIQESGRRTLCLSCQSGCALNCDFCATGRLGFQRHLTVPEIVDQVLYAEKDVQAELTNVVFMGMGEPFLNYDNVIAAAKLINHPDGIAIGHRRIVISTAGIVPAIRRYTDENQPFRLAVSLNSPFQEQREQMMPVGVKWNVEVLMAAVKYYAHKSGQRPTFEYVMMAERNMSQRHAMALKKLVKDIPCKVNLIPFNATAGGYKRPGHKDIVRFAEWLSPLSAPVSVRWSKGDDVNAACGQLAGQRIALHSTS